MSRKRRFLSVVVLSLFVCAAVALPAVSQAGPEKITLTAVSAWPKTVFEVQNFMKFLDIVKANVAQKYPGELEILYKGGPEVIPNREQTSPLPSIL
ncbi:MAG: hypothetical protein V1689_06550 [Pseudomonadota bacterium]